MMKKCSVITGMILASLLLFMNSCEKDYLNAEEISYSLTVSDTVYLNEPVTIKGVINQDLDIRVYWENWNNDHLIGVLKPYRDSIVWIPENIKEGPANLLTQIAYNLIPYLYVNPIQVCLLLIEQAIREGICADDVVKLSVILNVIFF